MVQIIQSGPSQATLRQQALDQATQNILGGIGAYQAQQKQEQQTQRQQALQALDTAIQLRGQGYDVNPEQVQQLYAQPQAGFGDVFSKRTAEFTAKQEAERAKLEREAMSQGAEIEFKKAQAEALKTEAPLKAQERMLQMQKVKEDLAMSPIARRKAEQEIKKLERESTPGMSKLDQKLVETQATELAKKTTNLYSVKTAMDKALNQLSDPNRTDEEKIKTGQGLLKLLNSAEGSDAVGAEEAKRIGDYLEFAMGNFTGPGGMRVGRDIPGFISQVSNYSELLGERIKGNEQGLQAIKGGVPLSQVSGMAQSQAGGLSPEQAQRLQELRAKQQGMAAN